MKRLLVAFFLVVAPSAQADTWPPCPRDRLQNKTLTTDVTNTSSSTLVAAPSAPYRIHVGALCVTNKDATVGTVVKASCSATAANGWRLYAAPAGGGWCIPMPLAMRCDAATALTITAETDSSEVQAAASVCVDTE